jgi:hypothetical protein
MPISSLDALLGFALAYSATYVLYVWIRSDAHAPSPPDTGASTGQLGRTEVRDAS